MTLARSLLSAMMAVILLTGARPLAGDGQFPRGLMSSAPRTPQLSCTIETRPLSFGIYDPLAGRELDAIGQIIYVCEKGGGPGATAPDPKGIRIEMGRGFTNSYSQRGMAGLSDTLFYNIYLDATHRTIWGDGTNGTEYYFDANPPNRKAVIVPAFGRIQSRQDVPAGQYADTVAVRILF